MAGSTALPHRFALALLALLAIVAYGPLLGLPLFEDDFPNLMQAQQYGSPADAFTLLHNPVFRLRATSFWIMFLLWRVAKLAPLAYHLVSLTLHVVNSWLLYGVCLAWPRRVHQSFLIASASHSTPRWPSGRVAQEARRGAP